MQPDFDYSEVPYAFAHCFNTKCPRAAKCLRYLVTSYIPLQLTVVCVVNPALTASQEVEPCSFFIPDRMKRYASGITHLLDKIPHAEALVIKREIYNFLGRNMYYRIKNHERLATPAQQEHIRQIFLNHGIKEEPVYDTYVEKYDWE